MNDRASCWWVKSTPMHCGNIKQPCDYKGMGGKPPSSSLQTGGRTPHELMARDPDLPIFILSLKEMKAASSKKRIFIF